MKRKLIFPLIAALFALSIAGCSNSTDPVTSGTITLSSKYDTRVLGKDAFLAGIDSIKITKATYLLREIKFKTQNDSTEGIYKTTPLVLELNLNGTVQTIQGLTVPFGTYNRLEFDIHKAEAADTTAMTADQRAKIRPFFDGTNRYSIIIEGRTYTGGAATNFVYKSSLNVKQKIDLQTPIAVVENNPDFAVTMKISSYGWFLSGNNFLDPATANKSAIDNNIRASIKAFKDSNKDGSAD